MTSMSELRTVAVLLLFVTALVSTSGLAIEHEGPAKLLAEARTSARLGNYPVALEKLNGALERARDDNDSLTVAIVLDNMAEVHRLQGRPAEALDRYTQALKIYQDIDHKLGIQATKKKLMTLAGQRPRRDEPPPPPEPVEDPAPGLRAQTREKLIDNAIDRIRNRLKGEETDKETDSTAALPRNPFAGPENVPASVDVTKESDYSTYLKTVKESIVRAWKYPEEASDGKEQGKVDVEFTIHKNGNLQDVQILRSSGFSALDREAIRAVGAASPFNPIPDQIGLEQLSIRFTFNYTLETGRSPR